MEESTRTRNQAPQNTESEGFFRKHLTNGARKQPLEHISLMKLSQKQIVCILCKLPKNPKKE